MSEFITNLNFDVLGNTSTGDVCGDIDMIAIINLLVLTVSRSFCYIVFYHTLAIYCSGSQQF